MSTPDAVAPPRHRQHKPLQDRSDPYSWCLQSRIQLRTLAFCRLWHSCCRSLCCCSRTWASLGHAVGPSMAQASSLSVDATHEYHC